MKFGTVNDARRGRFLFVPQAQHFETHEIVFWRQCRNPEVTVPHQLAQHRLIPLQVIFTDGYAPALDEFDNLRASPESDDAAIEVRKRIWKGLAPNGLRVPPIQVLILHHSHVEAVQDLENVADIGNHEKIRVKIQRSVETAEEHGIHLGPPPRIVELMDSVKHRHLHLLIREQINL